MKPSHYDVNPVTIEEIKSFIERISGLKTTAKQLSGSMKNYVRFTPTCDYTFSIEDLNKFADKFPIRFNVPGIYSLPSYISIHKRFILCY